MRSRVKPADSISILSNSGKNREMKKHEGKRSNFEVWARGLHPPQDRMFLAGLLTNRNPSGIRRISHDLRHFQAIASEL